MPAKSLDIQKQMARQLKVEILSNYPAFQDPGVPMVPRCARLFAACLVACAFNAAGLVPDFIPVPERLDGLAPVPGSGIGGGHRV